MATKAEPATTGSKNSEDVKKMSKHGFLDMLKKSAIEKKEKVELEKSGTSNKSISSSSEKKKTGGEGWNALKDDFMMNAKLQDWDKALSSSDDEDASDDNVKKRDADDIMDDWSSDEEGTHKRRKMRT